MAKLVRDEWKEENFMAPGQVPANWRHQRLAIRVRCADPDAVFLDVESVQSRAVLSRELAPLMATIGIRDLDVAAIRGGDRRLTRFVSHWAWLQVNEDSTSRYAGVRYLSRLNTDWECWALFDRVPTQELERRPILRTMVDLEAVARLWRLTVH